MTFTKTSLFFLCLCLATLNTFGQTQNNNQHSNLCQHNASADQEKGNLQFISNKNQWHSNIKYAAPLGGLNHVFLEDRAFTYVLYQDEASEELHEVIREDMKTREQHMVPGHAYKVHFLNALKPTFSGSHQRSVFNNYFLGDDPQKWASEVPLYEQVTYENIYKDIQLSTYSHQGNFKYDFILAAQADPNQIQLKYEGMDRLYLEEGNLIIKTSVKEISELAPYAYQIVNGLEQKVNCQYVLKKDILSFYFPDGYNTLLPLIIDPTVVGATLSGSSINTNFGHSATFDSGGNIYAAGISFGTGYNTTTGAFQTNFAGGENDIAVSKYNPDGSELIYATYIGGSGSDYPHSTIVDVDGQLCIYGSTRSNNYPTTNNALQPNHGGNTDIIITKLNATGSALVGSTYVGGSGSDGRNLSAVNAVEGEAFRGEIILDAQGDIYVASCTSSSDFPVTANAYQTTFNDEGAFLAQDGVLLKVNSDLSSLFWATYLGGDDPDVCYSLKVDKQGDIYCTGYAGTDNFPMVSGGLEPNWPGGAESAYVVKLSADGSTLLNSTFWGTSGNEHSYFIDIDEEDQVHIYGTTTGNMPITPDTYFSNEGSNQFLAAFSPDLSSLVYSTVIGTGGSSIDFIPVALMVDKCNGIYFSGYRSSANLPLTSDAIYGLSNSFYLAVLEPNATALSFGTYYGRANHVDGGTSRFDKGGIVYQGVCSCLTGSRVMNTTPNAYATSQSTSCDIGVFKIDFEVASLTASAQVLPATSGCLPFTANFRYTGQDAETIFWDFGNGDSSTEFDPTYTFTETGVYTVTQIVEAGNTCNLADTFRLVINVLDNGSSLTNNFFCPGTNDLFLDATITNATYLWQDGSTGSTFQPTTEGIYWVDATISGCTQRDSFNVLSNSSLILDLGIDQSFCDQQNYTLNATNATAMNYLWQDGSTDPTLVATSSGLYNVLVTDDEGCIKRDSISLAFGITPIIDLGLNTSVCAGETFVLDASNPNVTYLWQDGSTNSTFSITQSGVYQVTLTDNDCSTSDSIEVLFSEAINLSFETDSNTCLEDSSSTITTTVVTGGDNLMFQWDNGSITSSQSNLISGSYFVTVTNEDGCSISQSVDIAPPSPMFFDVQSQDVNCYGELDAQILVEVLSGGTSPYLYAIDSSQSCDRRWCRCGCCRLE